jgi:hypothetical protein
VTVNEAFAVGALVFVVISIWRGLRALKRVRAIEAGLGEAQLSVRKMQLEIRVLQRHLLTALAGKFKLEAPKIQPSDGPVEIGDDKKVRLVNPPANDLAQTSAVLFKKIESA